MRTLRVGVTSNNESESIDTATCRFFHGNVVQVVRSEELIATYIETVGGRLSWKLADASCNVTLAQNHFRRRVHVEGIDRRYEIAEHKLEDR